MPQFFPAKYTDAEAVAAAKADADIAAMLDFYLNPPRARAYRATSVQTLATGVITKIQLNAETLDNLGEFDPTTNFRFTAIKPGNYPVTASINFADVAAGVRIISLIYANGAEVSRNDTFSTGDTYQSLPVSDEVYLAAGGYIELWGAQVSGGNISVNHGSSITYMAIHKSSK